MKIYYFLLTAVLIISKSEAQTWENINMTFPQGDSLLSASQITFANKKIGWIFTEESYIMGGQTSKIYKTTNGGHNWLLQYSGNTFINAKPFSLDSLHCWAINYYGNLIYTKDGGEKWDTVQIVNNYLTNPLLNIYFFNENQGIILSYKQPWLTTDGGKTWNAGGTDSLMISVVDIEFINNDIGWFISGINPHATECGYIAKTTDGGKNWHFQDHYYPDSTGIITPSLNGLYFFDSLSGFAIGNNSKPGSPYILSTKNGGQTWNRKQLLGVGAFYDIDFFDKTIGWITGSSGKIWKTTDGGINWSLQSTGINSRLAKLFLFPKENAAYIWGDNNYQSPYTLLYADLNSLTSIYEHSTECSKKYFLNQNYPNPFNPKTLIEYQLPKDGFVSLKVYDILGREVRTLVDENKKAGKYSVNFDAAKLASGVYIYRLRVNAGGANSFVMTRKMQLLK